MFLQFQRPLLDKVNNNALGDRNDASVLRVLDPTQDHLHVVYLMLSFFKSWATHPCVFKCSENPLREFLSTCKLSMDRRSKAGDETTEDVCPVPFVDGTYALTRGKVGLTAWG